jgi:dihydrofolate reductase
MRKLIVSEWMTLDGVVQSPTSPTEDAEAGFKNGGWHAPHSSDPMFRQSVEETVNGAGGFVLGRRTYLNFAAYWPNAPKDVASLAKPLNAHPKYVASTTLGDDLSWQNSTLLQGDVAERVASLKRQDGDYLLVVGSTTLVHYLMQQNLVDEFRLMIDPVLVGDGKRIFPNDGTLRSLRLVNSKPTPTGAVLVTYERSKPEVD